MSTFEQINDSNLTMQKACANGGSNRGTRWRHWIICGLGVFLHIAARRLDLNHFLRWNTRPLFAKPFKYIIGRIDRFQSSRVSDRQQVSISKLRCTSMRNRVAGSVKSMGSVIERLIFVLQRFVSQIQ